MAPQSTPDLDASELRIQSYLRRSASRRREVEEIGPFLALFDPHTDHPFLSYAIPHDGARPAATDVTALIRAFRRRDRLPRLEYLPGIAPAALPALLRGGFTVEADLPLMTCTPASHATVTAPAGFEVVEPRGDEDILAVSSVASAAFGEPPPGPVDVQRLRETLDAGGASVLARMTATGIPAGSGQTTPPGDKTTELAGIGVAEPFRHRGLAAAITSRLAALAFGAGVETAFLTPGDGRAFRAYTRTGFAPTTRMLHVSVR